MSSISYGRQCANICNGAILLYLSQCIVLSVRHRLGALHADTLAATTRSTACGSSVGSHACQCMLWGQIQNFCLIDLRRRRRESDTLFATNDRYRRKDAHTQRMQRMRMFFADRFKWSQALTHPIIVCSPVISVFRFFYI